MPTRVKSQEIQLQIPKSNEPPTKTKQQFPEPRELTISDLEKYRKIKNTNKPLYS